MCVYKVFTASLIIKTGLTTLTREERVSYNTLMCVAHLPEGHFLQVYFLRAKPSPGVSSKEKLLTGSPAANPLGLISTTASSSHQPLHVFYHYLASTLVNLYNHSYNIVSVFPASPSEGISFRLTAQAPRKT